MRKMRPEGSHGAVRAIGDSIKALVAGVEEAGYQMSQARKPATRSAERAGPAGHVDDSMVRLGRHRQGGTRRMPRRMGESREANTWPES